MVIKKTHQIDQEDEDCFPYKLFSCADNTNTGMFAFFIILTLACYSFSTPCIYLLLSKYFVGYSMIAFIAGCVLAAFVGMEAIRVYRIRKGFAVAIATVFSSAIGLTPVFFVWLHTRTFFEGNESVLNLNVFRSWIKIDLQNDNIRAYFIAFIFLYGSIISLTIWMLSDRAKWPYSEKTNSWLRPFELKNLSSISDIIVCLEDRYDRNNKLETINNDIIHSTRLKISQFDATY